LQTSSGSQEGPSLFALALDNGFTNREAAFNLTIEFYSALLRSEIDWKIVILISDEQSAIISVHLVEIWRD